MKIKRFLYKTMTIIGLMLIAYILYVSVDIYLYGNISEISKADAAIVLGAGIWDNKPSPVFEERINHGIWLYRNKYIDKLIFTGGKGENRDIAESEVARAYAIDKLIPKEDILIEVQSKITQENLYYVKQIAEKNNLKSFIIISDPLHMKRAMLMAKDYGSKAYSSPTPTTRYKTFRSKFSFLAREVFFYICYKIYRIFF